MGENILYSFRRCPYAMRARWAILKVGLIVTLREVDLKRKPKELVQLSPKATVPVLLTSTGKIIDESIDIILWALQISNQIDKIKTKEDDILDLITENDHVFKYHLDRFKYSSRYDKSKVLFHRKEAIKILYKWNKRISKSNNNKNKYCLVGSNESIADWSLWPFVRQYKIADPEIFEENQQLENLNKWLNYYINSKLFKPLMIRIENWEEKQLPIKFGIQDKILFN